MTQTLQKNSIMEALAQSIRYNGARVNLLLVVIFTMINMILLVSGKSAYYLFSASIPYTFTDYAKFFCGMYPQQSYAEVGYYKEFLDPSIFYIVLAISLAIVAFYLLAFFFSKNQKVGWVICALILFLADTVWLVLYSGLTGAILMDMLFHLWVIFSLAMGIYSHFRLKKLPTELITPMDPDAENDRQDEPDSVMLRYADNAGKAQILLTSEVFGHKIVYCRVRMTNELVIDGKVYGESISFFEKMHTIQAIVDGHRYRVGFDGRGLNYLFVDDVAVVQKVKLS